MKKSAFTLIELLVVIVIIAILAGIALPVYGRITEKAHVTGCMNNLRQLGIGTLAYLSDHEDLIFKMGDKWPEMLNTDPATNNPGKYVPNWKTFKSDFDKRADSAQTIPVSYGINTNILTQSTAGDAFDGNVAKMDAPSQLIYMAPVYQRTKASDEPTFSGATNGSPASQLSPGGAGNQTFGTHGSGKRINVLYMDNHVSDLKFGPASNTDAFQNKDSNDGKRRWLPKAPAATPP
jgi:prepilin-type N-terminal cleavage/methylation domain-containing protein/prepilin-type processing-associated H-X9-DG protein